MISYIISRLVIQVFGTLYPAYSSYKTVRTKDVKGYVQWMKYWIIFACLSCIEPFCDFFLSSWAPFYYESKILMVAWLLCPATRGYNYLYRAFVHPTLMDNEEYIDDVLNSIRERFHQMILQMGKRGSSVMIQTMLKGVLSRTSFGSYISRSGFVGEKIFECGEIDKRAITYHYPNSVIRTLYLAEKRRNSDPNMVRNSKEQSGCVQLSKNNGMTNFGYVRVLEDERRTNEAFEDEIRNSYRFPEEKRSFSLETLEEFDGRTGMRNQRLARLARKLSLEGFSDDHIGTVVATLISDVDPNLSHSSDEATEISSGIDESEGALIEEVVVEPEIPIQIEEPHHPDETSKKGGAKSKKTLENSVAVNDLKQPRAGRYGKLRAPCPPDSKKISDHAQSCHF